MSVRFVKGHGTENDFVLVPDPHDELDIGPEMVRAICDRRAGIGGDGLIRVATAPSGRWFMDYRNSDGSLAEMCGNGVRVFARYLVDSGLAAGLWRGRPWTSGTRIWWVPSRTSTRSTSRPRPGSTPGCSRTA